MQPTPPPPDDQMEDRLSPAETRRALWTVAIAWGVFGSTWMTLISGAPFVNFARTLGASTFMFGLLSSLPFLGVFAQLPASYLVEQTRKRRTLFMTCAAGQRATWFVIAALPWVIPAPHTDARVGALLALVMLSSTLGHLGTPAWFSWFADMVPEDIRGAYLGKRAALATFTAIIASAIVGWVLDRSASFSVFTAIFVTAAVFGLTDTLLFTLLRETSMGPPEGPPWRLRRVIQQPLSSKPFRGYLWYALSEAFMFGLAGPFFWLLGLEVLDIGNFWSNFYLMILPMAFTAMVLPAWGRITDRFGSKPLVTLGTLATIAFPLCWVLATPGRHHGLLAIAALLGGLFGAAIQVADMNMLFALTPRRNRSSYIALLSIAASLGWVIGPALGGAIAQILKPVTLHLAGRTFVNLHFLMVLSILARVIHVTLVVPRLPDEKARPTRELLHHLLSLPVAALARAFAAIGPRTIIRR
jgi:MFS family permease